VKKKKIRSTYTKNFFAMCKILYIRIGVSLNFLEYISQFCNIIRIQWLRKPLFNLHILLVSCENSAIKDRFNSTSNVRWMPIYSDTLMMKLFEICVSQKKNKSEATAWNGWCFREASYTFQFPPEFDVFGLNWWKSVLCKRRAPCRLYRVFIKIPFVPHWHYISTKKDWCNPISIALIHDSKYAIFYMIINLPCKHNLNVYSIERKKK